MREHVGLLCQGLSEPEYYGDLVYNLKKTVGTSNFTAQFIKINSHYKKIGSYINVLQQTACLVAIPITVCSKLHIGGSDLRLYCSIAPVFTRAVLLSPYLCFISFLCLDLYVLGDDS